MNAAGFALAILCAAGTPPRHTVSEITPEGEFVSSWPADLNGDGLGDLMIGVWTEARGRELLIYIQERGGAFPAVPDRRVRVLADIVAVAAADIRGEPGEELLFFTRSACFSYSTEVRGFAGNASKLFDGDLLCPVPDRKSVLRLTGVADMDGDGRLEVLVPGWRGYALFARQAAADGSPFARRAEIPVGTIREREDRRARRRRRPRENRIEFGAKEGSKREDALSRLVTPWGAGSEHGGGRFLRAERWIPPLHAAELNGDGRKDLMVLEGDTLKILLQKREGGGFGGEADWSGKLDAGDLVMPEDVDGDGLVDLIAGASQGSDAWTFKFYKNRGGSFAFERPDQVMKFSGYGAEPAIVDIERDGKPEFAVSSYSFSTMGAIRGGSIRRSLLLYRSDPEGVFSPRPDAKLEETFTAKEIKGIGQRVQLGSDVDGDGRSDALVVERDGALVARAIGSSLRIAAEPFWRFVPRKTILRVEPVALNGDARADMILVHIRSVTVLVSR